MREFKNGKVFILVKDKHMTQAMKNRCASYSNYIKQGFIKTKVVLVKMTTELLERERAFDGYVWYDREEILKEINDEKKYKKENC